ncbi:MAG: ABC transporter permease [Bacteroidota bacterium]
MKQFIGFVRKEFLHIFRDTRTIMILFAMPVVQLLLFGYVITNEIKDAKIAIYDQSKDEMTQKLTLRLLSSGYFVLEKNIQSYKEIEPCFKNGEVKLVVIFGPDFSKRLKTEGKAPMQIIADASEPNAANILTNYVTGITASFAMEQAALQGRPMQVSSEVRMRYNPNLEGAYLFVPGIIAMLLMLICAMMTSISITREKELGTMEVLLVSPLKPIQIIIGKVMPYLVLAFIDAVLIIIIAQTVFGVPVVGSMLLLLAECFLFIALALSLGVLISTVTSSQQTAMLISQLALMLPTILLSGFIFPIENMPQVLQWVCQIMPPKWFIIILRGIMLKGVGIEYLWQETLILAGFTILFIVISVRKFKIRLD